MEWEWANVFVMAHDEKYTERMHKNQKGFDIFFVTVAIMLLIGLGFAGWFVYQKNRKNETKKTPTSQTADDSTAADSIEADGDAATTYDAEVVSHIAHFDRATASLKDALVAIYYGDAKQRCDVENEGLSPGAQTTVYMTVNTVVRDAFASVTFCGAAEPSLLANISTGWRNIGSLTANPNCDLVDQFKVSKELMPTCIADGEAMAVTYP